MKLLKCWFHVVFFGGVMAASAQAQFVHLSFWDANSQFIFRATSGLIPWNLHSGKISRLDIFYAVDLSPSDGTAIVPDPSRGMWRAIVLSPLGNFEVVRPVQYVFARETYIEFQNYGETTYDGVFDFSMGFSPATAVGVMPVLPIAFDYPVLDLSGGRTFFDIPDLSEAYGYAVFHHATAEITDSIKFTPVPEPSTYALGGVAVLGLTLWWRHAVESRKRNRTIRV